MPVVLTLDLPRLPWVDERQRLSAKLPLGNLPKRLDVSCGKTTIRGSLVPETKGGGTGDGVAAAS